MPIATKSQLLRIIPAAVREVWRGGQDLPPPTMMDGCMLWSFAPGGY